ncbi:MAG: hypothetical protein LUG46_05985 [Erysipelotrichaceae bacterium]|nr:hypothetical protein [Erysipelotrichaceae bacterium]
MNIIGIIVFWITGVICIFGFPVIFHKKIVDYTKYPIIKGTVLHSEECGGKRWIVQFNVDNQKVLAMDDYFMATTFNSQKYSLPQCGEVEDIYYWKYDGSSTYTINGTKVKYYFHFCNENYYQLRHIKDHHTIIMFRFLGIILLVIGFLMI